MSLAQRSGLRACRGLRGQAPRNANGQRCPSKRLDNRVILCVDGSTEMGSRLLRELLSQLAKPLLTLSIKRAVTARAVKITCEDSVTTGPSINGETESLPDRA